MIDQFIEARVIRTRAGGIANLHLGPIRVINFFKKIGKNKIISMYNIKKMKDKMK